jgi:endonuclease G
MARLRGGQPLVILALLSILAGTAWAEICKGNKVLRAKLAEYDAKVTLSATERDAALQTHLPWGTPACPTLLPHQAYIVCYSPEARVALWAAYRLRAGDLVSAERKDAFRTDPRLSAEENASCADYADSGYDRGHIVPRDDMNRTPAIQAYTFYLTNMAPQTPALNRGIWRWLEELVRDHARKYDEIYVMTGSVHEDPARAVPSGRVRIPTRFYKVLIRTKSDGALDALGIVLPNLMRGLPVPPGTMGLQGERVSAKDADAFLAGHTVSIREVEQLTGLDLLPKLDAEALKRAVASQLWPRN